MSKESPYGPRNIEKMRVENDVEGLIGLLNCEQDREIRRKAAKYLGMTKVPRAVRAIEPLIQALKDEDKSIREAAAESLGKIGDKRAVEPLIKTLWDEYKLTRERAVQSLVEIGDESAVIPLLQALKAPEKYVRAAAAKVLINIGDKRALEPLIQALRDEFWEVRTRAARALGAIGNVRAVEPLVPLLKDENESVRWGAAEALGKLGDVRAIEPLVPLIRDRQRRVREAATESLHKLGWSPKNDIDKTYYFVARNEWDEVVKLKKPAIKPILQALNDYDDWLREEAAWALGVIGDARAVEPLIEALFDPNSRDVQINAAWALGKIGDKRAFEPLERVAVNTEDDEELVKTANEAIEQISSRVGEKYKDEKYTEILDIIKAVKKRLLKNENEDENERS